ncbi:MAG TPA: hypothetical protein VI076_08060 [Actinopolymorphaceae bacterium]
MTIRVRASLTAILAVAALAGAACETERPSSPEARPSPTASGACPTGGEHEPARDCVPYDGEALMRGNNAYRERRELPPETKRAAERHRAEITKLLASKARTGPIGPNDVEALLAPLGYPSVTAYGRSDTGGGLALGVSTGSGCVYGRVKGAEVTLEAGGAIADGGCLPAEGH